MREVLSEIKSFKKEINSKINTVFWVIGASVFVLGTIMAVLGLK